MNFLLRLAIIALLALIGALLFVMILCFITDPNQHEITSSFIIVGICIAAVLIPQK